MRQDQRQAHRSHRAADTAPRPLVGEANFLADEQTERYIFEEENERVLSAGLTPERGKPPLLGIAKARLSTESFISASSFQETTKVLTEAAICDKVDDLRGLKENVIMGRLLPTGTDNPMYKRLSTEVDGPLDAMLEESERPPPPRVDGIDVVDDLATDNLDDARPRSLPQQSLTLHLFSSAYRTTLPRWRSPFINFLNRLRTPLSRRGDGRQPTGGVVAAPRIVCSPKSTHLTRCYAATAPPAGRCSWSRLPSKRKVDKR